MRDHLRARGSHASCLHDNMDSINAGLEQLTPQNGKGTVGPITTELHSLSVQNVFGMSECHTLVACVHTSHGLNAAKFVMLTGHAAAAVILNRNAVALIGVGSKSMRLLPTD